MAFDTDNSLDLYTRVFDLWKQSTETQTLLRGHQRKLWNVDEWQLNNSLQHLAGETSLLYKPLSSRVAWAPHARRNP